MEPAILMITLHSIIDIVLLLLYSRLDELVKERRDHDKMQHPASKKQLEDVWNNQDGLDDEEFNPRTFFFLHGLLLYMYCY